MSETTQELRVTAINLRDGAYDLLDQAWHAEVLESAVALQVNPDGAGAPEIHGVQKTGVLNAEQKERPALELAFSNGQRFLIVITELTD